MSGCLCPTHPGCPKPRRRHRRQCTTCINLCGPFRLRTNGKPDWRMLLLAFVLGQDTEGRAAHALGLTWDDVQGRWIAT